MTQSRPHSCMTGRGRGRMCIFRSPGWGFLTAFCLFNGRKVSQVVSGNVVSILVTADKTTLT